jgi:hypothetical protein
VGVSVVNALSYWLVFMNDNINFWTMPG